MSGKVGEREEGERQAVENRYTPTWFLEEKYKTSLQTSQKARL